MVGMIANFYAANKVDGNVDQYYVFLSLFSLLLSLIKFKKNSIDLKTSAFLISWCATIMNRLEFMRRYSSNCREVLLVRKIYFKVKFKKKK